HQVLAYDRAGAEVEMTHLGVAHLPVREAHRPPAGGERRVRKLLPQAIEHRRARERDGIARPRLGQAPAVEHHQAYRAERQAERTAARGRGRRRRGAIHAHQAGWLRALAPATICAKDSGSSEAPPTSAPSTSGSASSSAAFSAFTEPP